MLDITHKFKYQWTFRPSPKDCYYYYDLVNVILYERLATETEIDFVNNGGAVYFDAVQGSFPEIFFAAPARQFECRKISWRTARKDCGWVETSRCRLAGRYSTKYVSQACQAVIIIIIVIDRPPRNLRLAKVVVWSCIVNI